MTEDFLRLQHPLPALPVEEHDSEQELSIIEPNSHSPGALTTDHLAPRSHSAGAADHATGSIEPLNIVKADATLKHSKSIIADPTISSNASQRFATPNRQDNGPAVPVIATDMFSSVLGGLHCLPIAPTRKPSRLGRIKRFFSLKRHRHYGRASS
jgi:hypothetical protein